MFYSLENDAWRIGIDTIYGSYDIYSKNMIITPKNTISIKKHLFYKYYDHDNKENHTIAR